MVKWEWKEVLYHNLRIRHKKLQEEQTEDTVEGKEPEGERRGKGAPVRPTVLATWISSSILRQREGDVRESVIPQSQELRRGRSS